MTSLYSRDDVRSFFAWSNWLDHLVLRPLSHIAGNWEVSWDHDEKCYRPESDSFAEDLNEVIELIATCPRPLRYHDHEDWLAEKVVRDMKWPIQKRGSRWVGGDYPTILEQGSFDDLAQKNLIAAAAGRVHTALDYEQKHFDEMEEGHLYILAALISIVLYHRHCDGTSKLTEESDDKLAG